VHLVRRKKDGREFAMKIMNLGIMNAEQRNRAENESDVLKRLVGPCVIRYFDSFKDNDCLCIVMEYAERGSLRSQFDEHRNAGVPFENKQILSFFWLF